MLVKLTSYPISCHWSLSISPGMTTPENFWFSIFRGHRKWPVALIGLILSQCSPLFQLLPAFLAGLWKAFKLNPLSTKPTKWSNTLTQFLLKGLICNMLRIILLLNLLQKNTFSTKSYLETYWKCDSMAKVNQVSTHKFTKIR